MKLSVNIFTDNFIFMKYVERHIKVNLSGKRRNILNEMFLLSKAFIKGQLLN